jgi:thermitase
MNREANMSIFKSRKTALAILLLAVIGFSSGSQQRGHERTRTRSISPRREILSFNAGRLFHAQGPRYSRTDILVKFKPTVQRLWAETAIAAYGARTERLITGLNIYKVRIPEGASAETMVEVMKQNPQVELAELNYIARISVTPNDTLFSLQYALYNTAQEIGIPGSPQGKNRADIKATAAWEETKGRAETVIAVADTGVDLLHPDIKNKIKSAGRDIVNNDDDATDDNGHGTYVAGIAAAETNNNQGIAGVAWNAMILPIKVVDQDGSGYYDWIIEGIKWAADNGADVINLSLGGEDPSEFLLEACKYAYDKRVVIVASAGNDNTGVYYPAAYDAYVLAVSATDYNDSRPEWGNYGPQVDVAAPGVRVVSLVPTWYFGPGSLPYGFGEGTSASAPHVAGLAALLKGYKPWLKVNEIMDIIRYSADDVNSTEHPGKDDLIGYGRINMEKALVPIKITK